MHDDSKESKYQVVPIVCVDDRFGMAFNKRRCSSDVAVLKDILGRTENARLWTDSYSAKLFSPESEILVDDRAFEKAEAGEYVFCERVDPGKYQDRIEKVLVYFWNRKYPSDTKLTLDPEQWNRTIITEFPGHSHEKITLEEWTRK